MSTLRMILIGIVMILVGIICYYVLDSWKELERLRTEEQQWKASSQSTSQVLETATTQTEEKQKVEFIITDRRAASDRRFLEVQREDQTAADWAATPIPDSVRSIDADPTGDGTPGVGGGSEGADRGARGRGSDQKTR